MRIVKTNVNRGCAIGGNHVCRGVARIDGDDGKGPGRHFPFGQTSCAGFRFALPKHRRGHGVATAYSRNDQASLAHVA